jgi:hypothetical protein
MRNRPLARALLEDVNAICTYVDRYSLHENHWGMALFCKQGQLDRNDSGWLPPEAMVSFLSGFLVGYDTARRRTPTLPIR